MPAHVVVQNPMSCSPRAGTVMAKQVYITDVTSDSDELRVKVLGASKSNVYKSGKGKRVQKMILIDEQGNKVEGVLWNHNIDTLKSTLVPLCTYIIGGAQLGRINPMYQDATPGVQPRVYWLLFAYSDREEVSSLRFLGFVGDCLLMVLLFSWCLEIILETQLVRDVYIRMISRMEAVHPGILASLRCLEISVSEIISRRKQSNGLGTFKLLCTDRKKPGTEGEECILITDDNEEPSKKHSSPGIQAPGTSQTLPTSHVPVKKIKLEKAQGCSHELEATTKEP